MATDTPTAPAPTDAPDAADEAIPVTMRHVVALMREVDAADFEPVLVVSRAHPRYLSDADLVILRAALKTYRKSVEAQMKKASEAAIPTDHFEDAAAIAAALLAACVAPEPGDPRQASLPFADVPAPKREPQRVKCLGCEALFAVEVEPEATGMAALRRCPSCGAVHHVRADAAGAVYRLAHIEAAPAEVVALWTRAMDPNAAGLSPAEQETLDAWLAESAHGRDRLDTAIDPEAIAAGILEAPGTVPEIAPGEAPGSDDVPGEPAIEDAGADAGEAVATGAATDADGVLPIAKARRRRGDA